MPYIKKQDRKKFKSAETLGLKCDNPGDLNYVFTVIAQAYIRNKGLRYQNINDVVGALEGAKTEFYRRVAAPYEDEKIAENGDVLNVEDDDEKVVQKGEI